MDDRETITEQLRKQWEAIIENDKEKNLTPGELIRKKAREDIHPLRCLSFLRARGQCPARGRGGEPWGGGR